MKVGGCEVAVVLGHRVDDDRWPKGWPPGRGNEEGPPWPLTNETEKVGQGGCGGVGGWAVDEGGWAEDGQVLARRPVQMVVASLVKEKNEREGRTSRRQL